MIRVLEYVQLNMQGLSNSQPLGEAALIDVPKKLGLCPDHGRRILKLSLDEAVL